MPFSRFMDAALYHPDYGYYTSAPQSRTGKSGDFFTSVSVGPLFGALLARRAQRVWLENGSPSPFHIIEAGAHDGTLARDILTAAAHLDQSFAAAIHYHLIESSAPLRSSHSHLPADTSSHASIDQLPQLDGPSIFLSNELFDAFPVECLEMTTAGWQERHVIHGADGFGWTTAPVTSPPLAKLAQTIGTDYPTGTLAEARIGLEQFLSQLSAKLPQALFITIDYGFARAELYHPDRLAGTLSAYRDHQRVDDVLADPGSADLTTHIDFTQLAEAHATHGQTVTLFASQSSYFTTLARPYLLELEAAGSFNPAVIRQFKSLTHPGVMGRTFQVLEAHSSDIIAAPPIHQSDPLSRLR